MAKKQLDQFRELFHKAFQAPPTHRLRNLSKNIQIFIASPYGKFFSKGMLLGLIAYACADITNLLIDQMVPFESFKTPLEAYYRLQNTREPSDPSVIHAVVGRNLFNQQGLLPGEMEETHSAVDDLTSGGARRKTSLPVVVVGVILFEELNKSLVNLEDTLDKRKYPVRTGDEIPAKLKVLEITWSEIVFLNLENRQVEFLAFDQFEKHRPQGLAPDGGLPASPEAGIQEVKPQHYRINRSSLDRAFENLGEILTQAQAVPNLDSKGKIRGFKMINIQRGSVYEQLGIKEGDVVLKINGEQLTDPAQSVQMLNGLKNSNYVEITLEQKGVVKEQSYEIQ